MIETEVGIVAYATYAPRYVLTREAAKAAWPYLSMPTRSRSVPALDEDPITMGAHAALIALRRAGLDGSELGAIVFASGSSPYVVKSAAAVVGDYVGAPASAWMTDIGAGSHAGVLALVQALRQAATGEPGPILVVAADAATGDPSDVSDLAFGAGAVAFVVGRGGRAVLEDASFRYSSFSNQWQASGQRCVQRYDDERFDRFAGGGVQAEDAVRELVERAGAPDWLALQLGAVDAARIAKACDVPIDGVVGVERTQREGDTGCANATGNLALALDRARAGDRVVVQGYGAGAGAIAAVLRVLVDGPGPGDDTAAPETVELAYVQFLRHRGHLSGPSIPSAGSAFAASPAWERTKSCSVGLQAQRCADCGSINFPRRDYCLDCRSERLDAAPLPRRGRVVTFNLQHILPIAPEEAPLPVCTVLLDGQEPDRYGGKVAALLADADLDSVAVGMDVELVPRRGDNDNGLVKYGWKFRPVNGRPA